jgi:RNA polymerase sigma-70 factor, ECF subfamily
MNAMAALASAANTMDDADERSRLINAARAGELAAFDSLMRIYERQVLATALRLLGEMADAQDASQEVFLRLYRNLGKLDHAAAMSGWLYRVTVNVCHDLRRKRPVALPEEEAAALVSAEAGPLETAGQAERRRALELSLRMLPERERAAVVLRDLEGLSTGEVARAMGLTEAAVRSHASQARIRMRGFLERYFRRRT